MMFDRSNIFEVPLETKRAHGGEGFIEFHRLADAEGTAGGCNFIDVAVVPPGSTIGLHRHGPTEEEFYLLLSGRGVMTRDGEPIHLRAGDLVRNRPGGAHTFRTTGSEPVRLFVFELSVP